MYQYSNNTAALYASEGILGMIQSHTYQLPNSEACSILQVMACAQITELTNGNTLVRWSSEDSTKTLEWGDIDSHVEQLVMFLSNIESREGHRFKFISYGQHGERIHSLGKLIPDGVRIEDAIITDITPPDLFRAVISTDHNLSEVLCTSYHKEFVLPFTDEEMTSAEYQTLKFYMDYHNVKYMYFSYSNFVLEVKKSKNLVHGNYGNIEQYCMVSVPGEPSKWVLYDVNSTDYDLKNVLESILIAKERILLSAKFKEPVGFSLCEEDLKTCVNEKQQLVEIDHNLEKILGGRVRRLVHNYERILTVDEGHITFNYGEGNHPVPEIHCFSKSTRMKTGSWFTAGGVFDDLGIILHKLKFEHGMVSMVYTIKGVLPVQTTVIGFATEDGTWLTTMDMYRYTTHMCDYVSTLSDVSKKAANIKELVTKEN